MAQMLTCEICLLTFDETERQVQTEDDVDVPFKTLSCKLLSLGFFQVCCASFLHALPDPFQYPFLALLHAIACVQTATTAVAVVWGTAETLKEAVSANSLSVA